MKQAIETHPAMADALISYGMESELTRLDIKNLPESGRVSKSFVSLSGDESVIEVRIGQSVVVPIKAVYVHKNADKISPKQVNIMMEPGDSYASLKGAEALTQEELLKEYSKCSGEQYDDTLFYNTGKLLSFPDESNIELHDREIKIVNMKITIPANIPIELVRKRVTIMPRCRVNRDTVRPGSRGRNLKILESVFDFKNEVC